MEQINLRHRLPTRAIKVKGLAQMEALYPYLQMRLNQVIERDLEPYTTSDGHSTFV